MGNTCSSTADPRSTSHCWEVDPDGVEFCTDCGYCPTCND